METGYWILVVCAACSFLVTLSLVRTLVRKKRALPRMKVSPGVVREMETRFWMTQTGGKRGATTVTVDFVVDGKPYVCRDLWFFSGNHHVKDVGKLYDFPAGQEVGLYYDPADPRVSAMMLDQPRYFRAVIAGLTGVSFAVMAFMIRHHGVGQ